MYNTIKLSVVMVFAFALQLFVPGFTETFLLDSADALNRPWILVTSIFLHGDVTHIMYNLLGMLLFGSILEKEIGNKFLPFFFASGLAASIVAVFFYDAVLGASGALFGILGALAVMKPRMVVFVMGVPMPMIAAAAVWLLLDIIGFSAASGIANAAHIAGLLFGMAVSYFYFRRNAPHEEDFAKTLSEAELDRWERKYVGGNKAYPNLFLC